MSLNKQDLIHVFIEEACDLKQILPEQIPISVLYEDEDLIVIDKPAGMPIHPSLNHSEQTLANALFGYFRTCDSPFVFRCVNRLDRDTSGITIVAKNPLSSAILNSDMKNGSISRTYYAIVEGIIELYGTIDSPIARVSESLIEREINESLGVSAVTHFSRIKTENELSLVSLKLETGRTHQIRVHMKSIGHPLIGDFLYNPTCQKMERQALHAGKISFWHPITKELICLHAPWPKDFIMTAVSE
ncbi:MAG: RluA family pseudouridine synthase [Lachnospiraceae bacterium]